MSRDDTDTAGARATLSRRSAQSLLGGTPDEAPDAYRRGSPVSHVRPGCPPTLQVFGDDDFVVDISHGRRLHALLLEAGVPSVLETWRP